MHASPGVSGAIACYVTPRCPATTSKSLISQIRCSVPETVGFGRIFLAV